MLAEWFSAEVGTPAYNEVLQMNYFQPPSLLLCIEGGKKLEIMSVDADFQVLCCFFYGLFCTSCLQSHHLSAQVLIKWLQLLVQTSALQMDAWAVTRG